MIITIDGPAGSGKSTVAKQLAEKLGFIYVDTGAMYRAVTYYVLKNKISLEKPQQLQEVLDSLDLKISDENGEKQYLINNQDVTSYLRSKEVTSKVSPVSALLEVREKLVAIQRSYAEGIDAVLEGRDMGTVVFPDANVKIFLTAAPEIRAHRRYLETIERNPQKSDSISEAEVLGEILKRDDFDSNRAHSPLCQAEDAYLLDTSNMPITEVVTFLQNHIKS